MVEVLLLDNVSYIGQNNAILKNLNLCAFEGEVHGVIGDYGISHSELLKLLTLNLLFHSGHIYYYDKEVLPLSPSDSIKKGIFPLSSNCGLFSGLSIMDNIYLTARKYFGWHYNKEKVTTLAKQQLSMFDIHFSLNVPISELSLLQKSAVYITGAIISGARLIVIDEITSSLGEQDSITFKRILTCLKFMGITVICIVNKIDELVYFTDRATLVKNGTTVRSITKDDYSYDKIITMLLI